MIVYNITQSVIFITTKFEVDPLGGPAKIVTEYSYSIPPGKGIDLSIIGLEKTRVPMPKTKKKKKK